MDDIVKVKKSLENLGVLIDGVPETKKQEGRFLGALLTPLTASIVQLVISSAIKRISRREVRRAGRGCMNKNF